MSDELNYFMVIPASVWDDCTISGSAERLYGRISVLTKRRGYCFASNSYFAQQLNTTPRTIQRWLLELVKAGHITVEVEHALGNSRKIWLNLGGGGHDKNVVRGHDKNVVSIISMSTKKDIESTKSSPTPKVSEFLDSLRADPYFEGVDIDAEYERAVQWCEKKNRALTQRFFRDWLGRADRPDLVEDDEPQEVEPDEWTEQRLWAARLLYPGMIEPPPLWQNIPVDIRDQIDAQVQLNQGHEKTAGSGNAGTDANGRNGGSRDKPEAEKTASGDSTGGTETVVATDKKISPEDIQT
jgi:Helix-turn-helix domain